MAQQMISMDQAKIAAQKVANAYIRAIDEVVGDRALADAIHFEAATNMLQDLLEILSPSGSNNPASEAPIKGQTSLFDHLPPGSY